MNLNEKVYLLFEETVESKLINPTFILDYPIEISPLSKSLEINKNIAARSELFIAGMELGNLYNELNDPFEQEKRFILQKNSKEKDPTNEEYHEYDEDFIISLEHGLAPTVGVGLGIDRLVMLLTGMTTIKDIILFPTLKKK
jgi:lysyl-tRNA synthetase class 2